MVSVRMVLACLACLACQASATELRARELALVYATPETFAEVIVIKGFRAPLTKGPMRVASAESHTFQRRACVKEAGQMLRYRA